MLTENRLKDVLDEVWEVMVGQDLSWAEAAQVWDALGEWIFSEGGRLDRRNASARMLLYVDEKYPRNSDEY